MTATALCMLHTVASLPPTFSQLVTEEVGNVDVFHMVDEALLLDRIAGVPLSRATRRVATYAQLAEESGACGILVTCSSVGEAAELARPAVDIPIFRIDEPMAEQAVSSGHRIGVLATLRSTLQPTSRLIERKAAALGATREVVTVVCTDAFDALRRGRRDDHDRIVCEQAFSLAQTTDVIVLAQASMARALAALPSEEIQVPVLTSPRSAVRQLRQVIALDDKGNS